MKANIVRKENQNQRLLRKLDDQYKHLLLPFQAPLEEATGITAKADFEFRPTKDDISNVKAPRRRSIDSQMVK